MLEIGLGAIKALTVHWADVTLEGTLYNGSARTLLQMTQMVLSPVMIVCPGPKSSAPHLSWCIRSYKISHFCGAMTLTEYE